MDQEKIGKFIYELRKKNNMTQKALADKLCVTSQAISKWENGRGIPDIEQIKRISDIFGVSMKEIVDGEVVDNTSVITKRIIIWVIVFLVFAIFLFLFFMENKNSFAFSKINTDDSCFLVHGIVAFNKNKKSIYISNIECNLEDDRNYLDMEVVLYEVDNGLSNIIYEYGKINDIDYYDGGDTKKLDMLLKDIEFDIDDYDCSCGNNACDNLYLRINLLDMENNIISYNIPLVLENKCFNS